MSARRVMRQDDKRDPGAKRAPAGFSQAAIAELTATPEENARRGEFVRQHAREAVEVGRGLAAERVADEALDLVEQARDAVEVHAAEAKFTLGRAELGVDRLAREALAELDAMLSDADVLADLCDENGSLSADQRERLYRLAEATRSDAPEILVERLEYLAPALPFSTVEPAVTARRVEAAWAEVEKVEQAAAEVVRLLPVVLEAGRQARMRLVAYKVGEGLGPARGRELLELLDGDLEAAERAAQACRDALVRAERALVDALAALGPALRDVTGEDEPAASSEVEESEPLEEPVDAGLELGAVASSEVVESESLAVDAGLDDEVEA